MKILELGCGSGRMSSWIASQIGSSGMLTAIDNSSEQIKAARQYAETKSVEINYQCMDAYDISQIKTQFDMIYCRFILHHLSKPRSVINDMYHLLKKGGVVAIEEGLVSHAFTYPYSEAFGNERFSIIDNHDNYEGINRDGNYGIKLYTNLYQAGFNNLDMNIIAPTLLSKQEKAMIKPNMIEGKAHAIESGLSEEEWLCRLDELDSLIEDDSAVIGFYQSAQVSGVKGNS